MLTRAPISPVPLAQARIRGRRRETTRAVLGIAAALLFTLASPNMGRASAAEDCNDGHGKVAIRSCTELIKSGKLSPENLATAYLNRAIAYANLGKLDKAHQDLDRSIELSPNDPLLFYNRGNIAIDQGALEKAISDFSAAIALDGSFALAYLNRGLAEEALGRIGDSIGDYRMALSLDGSLSAAEEALKRLEPPVTPPSSGS